MFPFIRKRLEQATADFVAFARKHIPGLLIALLAGAITLPLVQIVAGADMKQEAGLIVLYGLVGPLAVIGSAFVIFYIRAGGKLYAAATASAVLPPTELSRDVSAPEAIAYICFGAWGKRFFDAASSPNVSASWEYKQFHQAAADGDIPMWGRTSRGDVFEPIAKEFWLANDIDWFSLLKEKSETEPNNRNDLTQKRYIQLMTSRRATELMVRRQPPDVLRAKSVARQLSNLLDEGAIERNKLLPVLADFDRASYEAILVAWDQRVLAAADKTGVAEGTLSRFRTLDTFEPELMGEPGRGPEQKHLESIWNKKLQVLRTMIDEAGEWC